MGWNKNTEETNNTDETVNTENVQTEETEAAAQENEYEARIREAEKQRDEYLDSLRRAQADFANMIPGWLTQFLSVFGGMMAALGMGIILSFLVKKGWHYAVFLAGFILVTYFNLSTMAVAVIATIVGVVFYAASTKEA